MVDRVAAARIRLYYPRCDVRYNVTKIIGTAPTYLWQRATAPQAVDDEPYEEMEDNEDDLASELEDGTEERGAMIRSHDATCA